MKKFLVLASLLFAGLNQSANALPNEYNVYRPAYVTNQLATMLRNRGVSLVPPAVGVNSGYDVPEGSYAMVRNNQLIGSFLYVANDRLGFYELKIADKAGVALLTVTEQSSPCVVRPAGLCYQIDYKPENQLVAKQAAPFSVILAEYGVENLRYGNPVNVSVWRYQYADSIKWLVNAVLSLSGDDGADDDISACQQVLRVLAADPIIANNLTHVRINEVNGVVVVCGTVHSTPVYNLIVRKLINQGLLNVRVELNIAG